MFQRLLLSVFAIVALTATLSQAFATIRSNPFAEGGNGVYPNFLANGNQYYYYDDEPVAMEKRLAGSWSAGRYGQKESAQQNLNHLKDVLALNLARLRLKFGSPY